MPEPDVDEEPIPKPPPTVPATPYAKELTEIVERVVGSMLTTLEAHLDQLEAKIDRAADRDRLLFDKLTDLERKLIEHDTRLERLEAKSTRQEAMPRAFRALSDKAALKKLKKKQRTA